jgi:HD superfamily phosphodiesterase
LKFSAAKTYILRMLKRELPKNLHYHGLHHTWDVYNSAKIIAKGEGISDLENKLLLTAALYHDSGYILAYSDNETIAVNLVEDILPSFGYSPSEIEVIGNIILSTQKEVKPKTQLEFIMSDADHDYFGRSDYHAIADSLKIELMEYNIPMSDRKWTERQLDYLENHHEYYTKTAIKLRASKKAENILELKSKLVVA